MREHSGVVVLVAVSLLSSVGVMYWLKANGGEGSSTEEDSEVVRYGRHAQRASVSPAHFSAGRENTTCAYRACAPAQVSRS